MAPKLNGLSREFIIHPGETIKEILDERQMSQKELAIRTDVSQTHVSKVINGQKAISVGFAKKLEYALGIRSSFWVNLQTNYDMEISQVKEMNNISQEELAIVRKLRDIAGYLQSLGFLDPRAFDSFLVIELRRLLNLSNLVRIPDIVQGGAYRLATSPHTDPHVLFTWLRMSELITAEQEVAEVLDINTLKGKIPELKRLMFKEAPEIALALQKHLGECGIRFSIVRHFKGAPIQGVIQKHADATLSLVMTNRQRFADIFWFTFFHEIGHIINKDISGLLIAYESSDNAREWDADRFASNVLINAVLYTQFVHAGDFSLESIRRFSATLDLPPFILIGRLQRDAHLAYHQFAEEKKLYDFG